jgi:hypothetical protein
VGVYGGIEKGFLSSDAKDACDLDGTDCSVMGYRLGIHGEYGLGGDQYVPFVGANAGWAWEALKEEAGGDSVTYTFSGWELGLKAGVDMKASEQVKVGLFVGLAFGQYTKEKAKGDIGGVSVTATDSIPSSERAIHEWLTIGVRGTYGL